MNTDNIQSCYMPTFEQWGYAIPCVPCVPIWIVMFPFYTYPLNTYPYSTQITTGTNIVLQPNNQSK